MREKKFKKRNIPKFPIHYYTKIAAKTGTHDKIILFFASKRGTVPPKEEQLASMYYSFKTTTEKSTTNVFSYYVQKIQILFLSSISFLWMVFYKYFWPLINPLPSPTKWQRFATFLPAIGSFWRSHWSMKLNEPVINIHILTSFTRRRKRQRSPRVWISAVLIFHSGDSELGIKRS